MRPNLAMLIVIILLFSVMAGCSADSADNLENVPVDALYIGANAENDEDLPSNDASDINNVVENNDEGLLAGYTDDKNEAAEDIDAPVIEPYVSASGIVWVVAPMLDYTLIYRCSCGGFIDPASGWMIIDPVTGLLTENPHHGHGGGLPEFVYDRERNLFGHPGLDFAHDEVIGVHPLSEFAEIFADNYWILYSSSGLIAVQGVDSYLRSGLGITPNYWWLTSDAFSGQFAVMHNREFITDFIFDGGFDWWWRRDIDLIAMRLEGQWGFIDKYGNTALPFMFENLIIIDENTAFARYNGRYGILDIHRTIENKNNI